MFGETGAAARAAAKPAAALVLAVVALGLGRSPDRPTQTAIGDAPQGEAAAPVQARWVERAPLPERRTEVAATADGRYIYLAGGFGPSQMRASAPRAVWRYDPRTDQWEELTTLPEGVNHAPLQYYDGRLYVLGGFRGTGFTPIANVRIYDLETGEWSEGAPMPTPRGATGWTVLNGRIHVIGGNVPDRAAVDGQPGARITEDRSVNVHEAYDPATDAWTRLEPMPTPRNHLGAAAADGRIHAVLGRADGDYTMTTHEVYDPETDSWESAPDVPTGRSGVAVVGFDGRVYAFGGERLDPANRGTFDAAERYDPRTQRWERLPPIPSSRHGLGAAAIDGGIHVISGGPGAGFTFGNAHERLEVGS